MWVIMICSIFSIMCLINACKVELKNVDLKFDYQNISKKFKSYKTRTKREIKELRYELNEKQKEIEKLKNKLNEEPYQGIRWGYKHESWRNNEKTIPDGIIDAVKYAMNRLHPDNGGNQEDFIKFRKLYEELKGME